MQVTFAALKCAGFDWAVMVQGRTTELEQMLRQKELQIERLQQQLDSKKSDGSSDSSVDVCAAVDLDEDPSAAYANEVSCSPPPLPPPHAPAESCEADCQEKTRTDCSCKQT